MESTMRISSSMVMPICCSSKLCLQNNKSGKISYGFRFGGSRCISNISAIGSNGAVSQYGGESSSKGDIHRQRSSLESLFSCDKLIPEEKIEKPVGIALEEKEIGAKPLCISCQAKGAVLCATCSGSGLYVDSILESQGIIVKVRCLGCGGSGNIMCSECGGRGHLGAN